MGSISKNNKTWTSQKQRFTPPLKRTWHVELEGSPFQKGKLILSSNPQFLGDTLPETNIFAPKKWWFPLQVRNLQKNSRGFDFQVNHGENFRGCNCYSFEERLCAACILETMGWNHPPEGSQQHWDDSHHRLGSFAGRWEHPWACRCW